MTTFRPGVEHREERSAEFVKDSVVADILVIVRPSGDLRIERLDQLGRFLSAVSLHRLAQFLAVSFDRFRAWLSSGHASEIGRASCRERVWIWVVDVWLEVET